MTEEIEKGISNLNEMGLKQVLNNIFRFQEAILKLKTIKEIDDPNGKIIVRGRNKYKVAFYIMNSKALFIEKTFGAFVSPEMYPEEEQKEVEILIAVKSMGLNAMYGFCKEAITPYFMDCIFFPSFEEADTEKLFNTAMIAMSVHEFRHEMQALGKVAKLLTYDDGKAYFDSDDIELLFDIVENAKRNYSEMKKISENSIHVKQEVDAVIIGCIAMKLWIDTCDSKEIISLLRS